MTWQILNDDEKLWQISWNKSHWPYIPYRILIIGGSKSGKTNVLPTSATKYWQNLLMPQDLVELKNQLFTNRREKVQMKKSKNPKAFISYWKTIDNAYKNLEDYNPTKKKSVNIV